MDIVAECLAYLASRRDHERLIHYLRYLESINYWSSTKPAKSWKSFFLEIPDHIINQSLSIIRHSCLSDDFVTCRLSSEAVRNLSKVRKNVISVPLGKPNLEILSPFSMTVQPNICMHQDSLCLPAFDYHVVRLECSPIITNTLLNLGVYVDNMSLGLASVNSTELFVEANRHPNHVEQNRDCVLLANQFGPNYFHTLVETSARLFSVAQFYGLNHPYIFIVDGPRLQWHDQLLSALTSIFSNVVFYYLNPKCSTLLSKVLIVTPSRLPVSASAILARRWLNQLSTNNPNLFNFSHKTLLCCPNKPLYVFVDRGPNGTRSIRNHAQALNLLLQNNFIILDPSRCALDEQWAICSRAKVLVGVHGAGLANMLFMEKNSIVIELTSSNWISDLYPSMAYGLSIIHQFFLCKSMNDNTLKDSQLYVDCNRLQDFMHSMFV